MLPLSLRKFGSTAPANATASVKPHTSDSRNKESPAQTATRNTNGGPSAAESVYNQIRKSAETLSRQQVSLKTDLDMMAAKTSELEMMNEKQSAMIKQLLEDKAKLEAMLEAESGQFNKLNFDIVATQALCSKIKDTIVHYEAALKAGVEDKDKLREALNEMSSQYLVATDKLSELHTTNQELQAELQTTCATRDSKLKELTACQHKLAEAQDLLIQRADEVEALHNRVTVQDKESQILKEEKKILEEVVASTQQERQQLQQSLLLQESVVRQLTQEKEESEAVIQKLRTSVQQQIEIEKDMRNEIAQLKETVTNLQEQVEVQERMFAAEKSEHARDLESLHILKAESHTKFTQLENECIGLREVIEVTKKDVLETTEELAQYKTLWETSQNELDKEKQANQCLAKEFQQLQHDLKCVQEQKACVDTELESLKGTTRAMSADLQSEQEALKNATAERNNLEELKAKLQGELEESNQRLYGQYADASKLNKNLSGTQEELEKSKEAYEKLQQSFKKREAAMQEEKETINSKLKEKDEEFHKLEGSFSSMKELMVVELRKMKDMYEAELRDVREERDTARAKVQQIGDAREQELRKAMEEKEREIMKLMNEIEMHKNKQQMPPSSPPVREATKEASKKRARPASPPVATEVPIKKKVYPSAEKPSIVDIAHISQETPKTYARKEVSKKYAPPPSPAPKASTHQSCKENTPRGATQKASQARSQAATKKSSQSSQKGKQRKTVDLFEEYDFNE